MQPGPDSDLSWFLSLGTHPCSADIPPCRCRWEGGIWRRRVSPQPVPEVLRTGERGGSRAHQRADWHGDCSVRLGRGRARRLRPRLEVSMSSNAAAPPVTIPGAAGRLYNDDLAPTAPHARTWGTFSLFAMWMSDVHSVGGYTFAASLFFLGLTGWQVLISMTVGIMAVYFLMNLIGRPSQRYGIPYPVVARIGFGVMGANLAAVVRGIVGIVWYGVQTYFASKAVQVLVVTLAPSAAALTHGDFLGLAPLAWFSFLFMWFFQLVIFLSGMEAIRKFIDFCGPVVYVVMFALAIWMLSQTGFSSLSLQLRPPAAGGAATFGLMANAAMLIVAYFGALLLNFGDFAR